MNNYIKQREAGRTSLHHYLFNGDGIPVKETKQAGGMYLSIPTFNNDSGEMETACNFVPVAKLQEAKAVLAKQIVQLNNQLDDANALIADIEEKLNDNA